MLEDKIRSLNLPLVVGEGSLESPLWLVGEALGREEVEKLRPFVGRAGHLLDDILKAAGVERTKLRIENVVPTRPPDNKVSRLGEVGLTLEECEEWIRKKVERYKPKVVLALGDVAMKALSGRTGITAWRGSILEELVVRVIPTFHPSYIQRMFGKTAKKEREGEGGIKYTYGSARLTSVLDVRRAWEESISPSPLPSFSTTTEPSWEEVVEFLAEANKAPRLTFDIETKGKWIDLVGFSFDGERAISIPRGNLYWHGQEVAVDRLIEEVLWTHEGLEAQNGGFDLTILLANGFRVGGLAFDTLAAHHFMYPELPHDLHYLTSIYTKIPYYKWMIGTERSYYNCLDCIGTFQVATKLREELKEFGIEEPFFSFIMPLFLTILKMGFRGVKLDSERQQRQRKVLEYLIKRRTKEMQKLLGRDLNPNSSQQVQELVYGALKLPVQLHRKTKKPTVDEDALLKLSKMKGGENLRSILDVREVQKMKSTYADLEPDPDGRIRTVYGIAGTETGRLNSKGNYFGGGWNSQQVPLWFKKAIIAEEGKVLVKADLKFAEALLIAWFAGDKVTIEAVRNGADIYKWHAGRMFGKKPEEISKEERELVKPVILGCGYGLGPKHMKDMLAYQEKLLPDGRTLLIPTGITQKKANELKDLFFASCPAIGEYQEWVRFKLSTERRLVSPFGRMRDFLGPLSDDLFRKGYAYLPQGSCVDYTNRGLVWIEEQQSPFGEPILQEHDSIVVETLEGKVDYTVDLIRAAYSKPVVINGEPLVIPVEISSGKSWGVQKEIGVFNYFGRDLWKEKR